MTYNEKKIIQNTKNIIQCDRCSKTFYKLDNLRRHFHNKKICKPILNDIPIEQLIEKYKVKKGCYKCENCGKEYKTTDGKYKHKKKCSVNPIIIEKKTINILEDELESVKKEKNKEVIRRKELEKQVEQLILEKTQLQEANAKLVVNGNNNNSNLTTIGRDQNIIIVNNFGEENIEYLLKDENFIKKCIESPINSIHKYLDNVHFNKEHPENRNIKMTNLLGPYMDYIKEGKWNKIEKNILIPKIIDKSIDVIDDIAYQDLDSDTDEEDNTLNAWEKYSDIKYGDNKKLKDKIIKKATRQIYNETNKNTEEIKI
jgi:hypothetical protein